MSKTRWVVGIAIFAVLVFVGAVWANQEEKPLDNAQVIQMTKADLGDTIIIAKIKESKVVKFDLTTDDLMKLKEAGVSKDVIAAMLERTTEKAPPPSVSAAPTGPKVVLSTISGETDLKAVDGDIKTIVAPFVGLKRFIVFSNLKSDVRTKDKRPTMLVWSDRDPRKTCWYVKLDQDTDKDEMNRSIDVESPGMWGGVLSSAPDEDFLIKYDVVEEKPGVWRYRPTKDLKPGEYGLYFGKGEMISTLYGFGVDK